MSVGAGWPAVDYERWPATCDTVHAHTQVLGKLALRLAPPQPELLHAALRLTARGWETMPLPAPDGSGALVVALDLRTHEAVVEHSAGGSERIPLTPHRAVREVTRDVLGAVRRLGGPVEIDLRPQEVPWTVPLDEDEERAHYDPDHVRSYFLAAVRAAQVLDEFRAPFRGRSTPVVAWWGAFDLAVALFTGKPAEPSFQGFIARNGGDAEQIAVGWWPGDASYPRAAFYAYVHPPPVGLPGIDVAPGAAHWVADKGEFLLHWDDLRALPDPHGTAVAFARSFLARAGELAGWDGALLDSAQGRPPAVR